MRTEEFWEDPPAAEVLPFLGEVTALARPAQQAGECCSAGSAWSQSSPLLGLHDPGQPWEQWGCPIEGCGQWFLGPWDLEGHTQAEHPSWTATYQLLRPYPNQRQRVVYRPSVSPAS